MIELRAFGKLDFYWDNPRHNQRKIFASKFALKNLENLDWDLEELLDEIQKVMEEKNYHYCYIGKCRDGFSVDLTQFSEYLRQYLQQQR